VEYNVYPVKSFGSIGALNIYFVEKSLGVYVFSFASRKIIDNYYLMTSLDKFIYEVTAYKAGAPSY
jgi:hypothetical protein